MYDVGASVAWPSQQPAMILRSFGAEVTGRNCRGKTRAVGPSVTVANTQLSRYSLLFARL